MVWLSTLPGRFFLQDEPLISWNRIWGEKRRIYGTCDSFVSVCGCVYVWVCVCGVVVGVCCIWFVVVCVWCVCCCGCLCESVCVCRCVCVRHECPASYLSLHDSKHSHC